MMKWQQQYEQRQKELYLQLQQQQHKNLQSHTTALDLQSSLTTSSSSSPSQDEISSPDLTYDIGGGKEAVLLNDLSAASKPQSTSLSSSSNNNNNTTLKKKTPPKKKSRKNNMKPKDTRRHTSISFDEMCRLMRVYGSLKCLRNRTTTKAKNSNNNVEECNSIKIDSTKRKFYRWFPDLDERFVRNSETGCYEPKAGHVNEMAYRESMRMSDQNKLVMKRLNGRSGSIKVLVKWSMIRRLLSFFQLGKELYVIKHTQRLEKRRQGEKS